MVPPFALRDPRSGFYDNLDNTSDPNDPEVIIKPDISNVIIKPDI